MVALNIKKTLFFIFFIFISSCQYGSESSKDIVKVEIVDSTKKSYFIDVLEKNNIVYKEESNGVISVEARSIEELRKATQEYEDWSRNRMKK
jgi:hypothetical protein